MASYWLETLGCPKNQVDSDKLVGALALEGYGRAQDAGSADLVVVNTCAFVEAAREESVAAVLEMAAEKKEGARLVVTGCLAERYGEELASALPEVDQVAGFGVAFWDRAGAAGPAPVLFRRSRFDLLELPRPAAGAPWAYVKIAEGCDRRCGFCAIPTFRGPQRSRSRQAVLAEVARLGVEEVVLVAQDPVSWGHDARGAGAREGAVGGPVPTGPVATGPVPGRPAAAPSAGPSAGRPRELAALVRDVQELVERVRLLYLYPSGLTDELIDAMGGCPYFDLSLQHVSRPLLRRMRRYGDGERFLERISYIRRRFPEAALRSSFIIGYPGETEEDQDLLLSFLEEAQLDWAGFFAFSPEEGTHAASLPGQVPAGLVAERARECSELQDAITASRRAALVGTKCRALVDAPGEARSHREAPEIDGVINVPPGLAPGTWVELEITGSEGPDLFGEPVGL